MKIIDSSVPTLQLAHLAEMEVKHRCNQILELGFPLGGLARLFAQDWEGDVTVVMPATLAQVCNAFKFQFCSCPIMVYTKFENLSICKYFCQITLRGCLVPENRKWE